MKVVCGGGQISLNDNATVLDAFTAAGCADGALAALRGYQIVELNEQAAEGDRLTPLTIKHEEGRRIYERSLRYVMLLAVRRCFPAQQVRIEYSIGRGVLVTLRDRKVSSSDVRRIAEEMRNIIRLDLPFVKEEWPVEKAIDYYLREGQSEKAALLKRRKKQTITLYGCDGMWAYFYGAMTPSTGYVKVFELLYRSNGFSMQLPDPDSPLQPSSYVEQPKHLAVFSQSAEWCSILGVNNVVDLVQLKQEGRMRNFIRVNEALHEQAMGAIAREIVNAGKRIVFVAGPSSSGKTTFSGRMAVQLQVEGRRAYRLSMDDYYRDRDELPREKDGSVDLEHIQALDLPLLCNHLQRLLDGETVQVPRFDFTTGKRMTETMPLKLGSDEAVIIEGIHALNPMIAEQLPQRDIHRIFVSALTCINLDDHNRIRTTDVRLLRRVVRDYQFRGTTPEETLAMWPSVRRGEEKWIFPCQELADSMFNTALHYELPFLRHKVYDMICRIPESSPVYVLASHLRKLLNYVPDAEEGLLSEIPPLSLLREFIGGCTMELSD